MAKFCLESIKSIFETIFFQELYQERDDLQHLVNKLNRDLEYEKTFINDQKIEDITDEARKVSRIERCSSSTSSYRTRISYSFQEDSLSEQDNDNSVLSGATSSKNNSRNEARKSYR